MIDLNFKEALEEITAEAGCNVFEGFYQNVLFFSEALSCEIKFQIWNICKNIMSLQKKVAKIINYTNIVPVIVLNTDIVSMSLLATLNNVQLHHIIKI